MIITNDLKQVGQALYGPRWQSDLCRALGYSDPARMRQWLRGARPLPDGIRGKLVELLDERVGKIEKVKKIIML